MIFKKVLYLLFIFCSLQVITGQNSQDSIPQEKDTLYIYIKFLTKKNLYQATYKNTDNILRQINDSLQHKGYLFNKLIPDSIKTQNKQIYVYYHAELKRQRQIDSVAITSTQKYPANVIKRINRIYQNKIINAVNLQKLKTDLKYLTPFQINDPVINFKNGRNIIVINAEPQNFNSVGGFLGFVYNPQKQKIDLEGYLETKIYNLFNANETFNLKWQKKDKYQNLDWSYNWPFIRGTNIGFHNHFYMSRQGTSSITFMNEALVKMALKKHLIGLNVLYNFESLKQQKGIYFGVNYQFNLSKNNPATRFIKSNVKFNIKDLNQWLSFIKLRYDIPVSKFIYYVPKIQWLITPAKSTLSYQQIEPDILRKYIADDTNYRQIFSFKNELKYTAKNTSFYLIGDYIHKETPENLLTSYINTGLGLEILNKKQILTFEIIKPVNVSYLTDNQSIYINIKQAWKF